MDLVEVAPSRDEKSPPVCKVMDYGRWRFEEDQRAKESRRKATTVTLKEMRYRPKIAGGDFETKTRKVADFLSQGHKVKVTIMFRWRETAHPEFGRKILDRIAEKTADIAKVEAMPKLDGRNMTMVLAPEKKMPEKKAPDRKPANGTKPEPEKPEASQLTDSNLEGPSRETSTREAGVGGPPPPSDEGLPEEPTSTEEASEVPTADVIETEDQ